MQTATKNTIVDIISVLTILLFTYTGAAKLIEHAKFEIALIRIPLVRPFYQFVSYALPIFELLIAALLITNYTRKLGFALAAMLMTALSFYIAFMLSFAPELPCTCGGVISSLTWFQHLIFNILFTLLTIIGWRWSLPRKDMLQQQSGKALPAGIAEHL